MKILLAGASGFLGTALRTHLDGLGHETTQLVRDEPTGSSQMRWDPFRGDLEPGVVAESDVVVNLAGAPVAHWPWTSSYRQKILASRIATSSTIAETIAESESRPALVNASAIGYYGDRGDEVLDEGSGRGAGFLAEVVEQWESATDPARDAGGRVVIARTSVVLHRSGGALKLLKLPFLVGLGGRIGSGQQWFPTVSLNDYLAAMTRFVTDASLDGVFNVVAPVPCTNAEFTKELGHQLHRPTLVTVPTVVVKTVGGAASGEVLGSIRAVPTRLIEAGFEFDDPTIGDQLEAAFAP